jgi:hypothetical protein
VSKTLLEKNRLYRKDLEEFLPKISSKAMQLYKRSGLIMGVAMVGGF